MKTYSILNPAGQKTILRKIKDALQMKPGNRLVCSVEGDRRILRVHHGAAGLAGSLASDKGKGLSFDQIREAAAAEAAAQAKALKAGSV